jgi:hypothetical protein
MADVVKKSNTVIGRERKLGCHGFWYEERERERERYMSVLGLLGVFLVMKREILTGSERRERK